MTPTEAADLLSAAISARDTRLSWDVTADDDEGTVTATGWRRDDWRPLHDICEECSYELSPAAAELAAAAISRGASVEGSLAEQCSREMHERGRLCPRGFCDDCDRTRRTAAWLDARERYRDDAADFAIEMAKDSERAA